MKRHLRAAMFAAGLVAIAAGPSVVLSGAAMAAPPSPSLTSFGTARSISAYELSATGLIGTPDTAPMALPSFGAPPSLASSLALSPTLAFDSGINLDVAQRFDSYGAGASPFLASVTAPFLGLADGGRYAGLTYLAGRDVKLRLGTSLRSDRLDSFAFDPRNATGLPLAFDATQTRSLLAGLSWDFSDWAGLGVTAISSDRSGVPAPFDAGAMAIADHASTDAIGVSAHLGLGAGWTTSASYGEGLSQLDLKNNASEVRGQSYTVAIAKHGLFGDDAVGFAFSRPAPGLEESNLATLTASGDLPPMVVSHGQLPGEGQETDFQLGYVTTFLGGALALQTNAAYQMNYQGQSGANAVSLLSRAKIKF